MPLGTEERAPRAPEPAGGTGRTTVVVMTRNRRAELLVALDHLRSAPRPPPVIVVDNASDDDTVEAVAAAHPEIHVVSLPSNRGAAARNVGVRSARTPYVAFSDDDSWWAPGALERAADILDATPRLGLLAGRVLVGEAGKVDSVSLAMAASPLAPEPGMPGPSILGFLACASVVRREAFLQAGGFDEVVFFPGEETLLAIDLVRAGWRLSYVDDVVAIHHPSPVRDPAGRRALETRSALVTAWMGRAPRVALARTGVAARAAVGDAAVRAGLVAAVRALPAALAHRRRTDRGVERRFRRLEKESG